MRMSRKEAINFLRNTKTKVGDPVTSREMQKKLFSLGFTWTSGSTVVENTDCYFIIIGDDTFWFSFSSDYWNRIGNKEINVNDIINMKVNNDGKRPFAESEECFKEMLLHYPFGWVKTKDAYTQVKQLKKDRVELINGNEITYSKAFDEIEFSDGGTFGIENKNE